MTSKWYQLLKILHGFRYIRSDTSRNKETNKSKINLLTHRYDFYERIQMRPLHTSSPELEMKLQKKFACSFSKTNL